MGTVPGRVNAAVAMPLLELKRQFIDTRRSPKHTTLRIVMFGLGGTGKSATATSILHHLGAPDGAFRSMRTPDYVTRFQQASSVNLDGITLQVVDCPHLSLRNTGANKHALQSMFDSLPVNDLNNADVFLFVLSAAQRFTHEEEGIFRALVALMGPGFVEKMVVAITHADLLAGPSAAQAVVNGTADADGTTYLGFHAMIERALGCAFPDNRIVLVTNNGPNRAQSVANLFRAMKASLIPYRARTPLRLPSKNAREQVENFVREQFASAESATEPETACRRAGRESCSRQSTGRTGSSRDFIDEIESKSSRFANIFANVGLIFKEVVMIVLFLWKAFTRSCFIA